MSGYGNNSSANTSSHPTWWKLIYCKQWSNLKCENKTWSLIVQRRNKGMFIKKKTFWDWENISQMFLPHSEVEKTNKKKAFIWTVRASVVWSKCCLIVRQTKRVASFMWWYSYYIRNLALQQHMLIHQYVCYMRSVIDSWPALSCLVHVIYYPFFCLNVYEQYRLNKKTVLEDGQDEINQLTL